MKSKEIFQDALNHKTPARIPVDFGATLVSGMHVTCVAALRDYYGLDKIPVGTKEEVRHQVLDRCRILSKKGGFVFDAIHNVQALTPVDNIAAMISAVKEFNG